MCVVVIWFSSSSFQVGEIVKQIKLMVQQAPLPLARAISPVWLPFWPAWAARQSRKTQNLQRKHLLTLFQKLLVFSKLICFGARNEGGENGRMKGLVSTVQNGWVAFFNAGLLVSTRWSLSSPQWLGLSRHRRIGGFKVAILARYFWTRSAATTGKHWLI